MARHRMPEIVRAPKEYYRKFKLLPHLKRWLEADELDPYEDEESDNVEDDDWDEWAMSRMCEGPLINFGQLMVDAGMLKQSFSCVSDRCAPIGKRHKYHSCCADAEVSLVRGEINRLSKVRETLADYLPRREPRLRPIISKRSRRNPSFYLDEMKANLCRPDERCVFSKLDNQGRIRCHLWSVAKNMKVDRSDFQPYTCRTFPLSLTMIDRGRIILGTLNKKNWRHMGGESPARYPCLSDPSLPPIYESMKDDIDWMFGDGFSKVLKKLAKQYNGQPRRRR